MSDVAPWTSYHGPSPSPRGQPTLQKGPPRGFGRGSAPTLPAHPGAVGPRGPVRARGPRRRRPETRPRTPRPRRRSRPARRPWPAQTRKDASAGARDVVKPVAQPGADARGRRGRRRPPRADPPPRRRVARADPVEGVGSPGGCLAGFSAAVCRPGTQTPSWGRPRVQTAPGGGLQRRARRARPPARRPSRRRRPVFGPWRRSPAEEVEERRPAREDGFPKVVLDVGGAGVVAGCFPAGQEGRWRSLAALSLPIEAEPRRRPIAARGIWGVFLSVGRRTRKR